VRALVAQTLAEVAMTIRRGETLLLTIGIPVLLLLFFSLDPRGLSDPGAQSHRLHRSRNLGAVRPVDLTRCALDRHRI
jgi:uncharacterized protein (DUF58 family)